MLKQLMIAFALLITIVACSERGDNREAQYRIAEVKEYNPALCGSTGYGTGEYNISVRLVLKDAATGEQLRGYGRVMIGNGESGMSTGNANDTRPYVCSEGAATGDAVLLVFAPGHTPAAAAISLPKDTHETVEFTLAQSCTGGGQSCYDLIKAAARGDAQREAGLQEYLNATLNRSLSGQYTLQCVECDLSRGGFVKALGTYANGTQFALYHRSGWCSSGGADCRDTDCLAMFSGKTPSPEAAECLGK